MKLKNTKSGFTQVLCKINHKAVKERKSLLVFLASYVTAFGILTGKILFHVTTSLVNTHIISQKWILENWRSFWGFLEVQFISKTMNWFLSTSVVWNQYIRFLEVFTEILDVARSLFTLMFTCFYTTPLNYLFSVFEKCSFTISSWSDNRLDISYVAQVGKIASKIAM